MRLCWFFFPPASDDTDINLNFFLLFFQMSLDGKRFQEFGFFIKVTKNSNPTILGRGHEREGSEFAAEATVSKKKIVANFDPPFRCQEDKFVLYLD